jgi:hypothetical protein
MNLFLDNFTEGAEAQRTQRGKRLKIPVKKRIRWLRENKEGEKNLIAFPGQGNPRDGELSRLRKENADLREANEILKKATAVVFRGEPERLLCLGGAGTEPA